MNLLVFVEAVEIDCLNSIYKHFMHHRLNTSSSIKFIAKLVLQGAILLFSPRTWQLYGLETLDLHPSGHPAAADVLRADIKG
jgi:hypothetical protein